MATKKEKQVQEKPDTVKGLENIIESLKKSGHKADSPEVKAIQDLIKKQ